MPALGAIPKAAFVEKEKQHSGNSQGMIQNSLMLCLNLGDRMIDVSTLVTKHGQGISATYVKINVNNVNYVRFRKLNCPSVLKLMA